MTAPDRCCINVKKLLSIKRRPHMTHCGHKPGRDPAAQQSPAVTDVCYRFVSKAREVLAVRRREFITLLGGAEAWPLAARAQQSAMPVIGYLSPTSPAMLSVGRLSKFHQGLKESGYIESENVAIEYRWADGQFDRLPALAAELVRRQVSVIVTGANAATFAAKAATTTIPIVFTLAEDPVKLGLVASLNRPGGNATCINFVSGELAAKRLDLLRDLVPAAARVAVLVNPADATATETTLRDVERAARAIGLQVQVFNAGTSQEIHAVFAAMVRERPDALFLGSDPFFTGRRGRLVTLSPRHAIPLLSQAREIVEVGGLMSYGANIADAFRQTGVYAGRILKGEKPADLPVVQSSRYELVINAETARILGLTVPPTLLAIADDTPSPTLKSRYESLPRIAPHGGS